MSIFEWLAEKPEAAVLKKSDYDKSVAKIVKKAEESSRKNDTARAAWLYQMASVLARRAREWDDSVKYALLAAEHSEKEGKVFNAGWAYRSAALAATEKKDCGNAVNYAVKGADSFMLAKSSYAAKWCYNIAAEACKAGGDIEKAIKFCEKAHSIEPDEETRAKITQLKDIAPHPNVDQYAEKMEVIEFEPVRFEIVIENHSKETMRNIAIGSRDGKFRHNIDSLAPEEVKVFSYDTAGMLGFMKSPFNFISWYNQKDESFDMELEPAEVLVKPKIQVNFYISPDPVINKVSELVILVKNLSSSPLYDVKIDPDFPHAPNSSQSSPNMFEKIAPGEEMGAEWKVEPGVLGMQRIAGGSIFMEDENGVKYEEALPHISAEVLEKPHPERKLATKEEEHREEKKRFDQSITGYPVSESEYVELRKKLWNQQRGYTLRGASLDVVTRHVEENCRDMALVSRHDFKNERMLLYSFKLEGAGCLLTVIVKEDEEFIHLIMKLYTENREMLAPLLDRVSSIIRYTITTETEAREVEKVEIKKIINIIDSIVQRSNIASGGEEGEVTEKKTKITDSVVQRTDV